MDNIWDIGDEQYTQNSLTLSVTQLLGNSDLGHKSMFH